MARRLTAEELEKDLVGEHEARLSAENNARNAVKAMRELTEVHALTLQSAIAEARADERRSVMAEVSGDVTTHLAAVAAANDKARTLEQQLALWRAIGQIKPAVRGDRIQNVITCYGDHLELQDGRLVVRETDSPDVVDYLREMLQRREPEWIGRTAFQWI